MLQLYSSIIINIKYLTYFIQMGFKYTIFIISDCRGNDFIWNSTNIIVWLVLKAKFVRPFALVD